jgi:hypothetical protein
MEPAVRVELTTGGLRNRCSTTEPRWHLKLFPKKLALIWRLIFEKHLREVLSPTATWHLPARQILYETGPAFATILANAWPSTAASKGWWSEAE